MNLMSRNRNQQDEKNLYILALRPLGNFISLYLSLNYLDMTAVHLFITDTFTYKCCVASFYQSNYFYF